MLSDRTIRKILDLGQSRGADFTEVFVEESDSSSIEYLDRKIDQINTGNAFGVGIRMPLAPSASILTAY